MALTAGATVGRYQIQQLLGSGGMGEVYRAVDPTLGRLVALKVLRPEVSMDPERLSRFLHEARAASALNHPNILTVHEVGDHEQSRFLVTELIEGETLRTRAARGQLTLREILDVMIQAASALAAAHSASIVHRDIKPDNLMLRPDGYVKVLDFGVATFARPTTSSDAMATMAMVHAPETTEGMIVGTIAYMSPEQARGLTVDGRSDCYSLGVVLYELVTGRVPFAAPTTTDLLVAILEREPPPVREIARGLPLQLEWIIEKALEKDPNLRYQSIADFRVDLQRLRSALESGRLATTAAPVDGGVADAVLERELTDESPEVLSAGLVNWTSGALAVAAVVLIGVAMSFYHQAHPGASLPLQLPEGAVVTKARDTIESFGYKDLGSRTNTEFSNVLSADAITTSAGLPALRDAIKEGGPVAQWRAGVTHSANPSTNDLEPEPGDFSVRLDPRGQPMAFATGYATDAVTHAGRDQSLSIALAAITKTFGVDASGFENEIIERSFPAGKTELTFRNAAQQRYGHVEQFRVNLQGERLVMIDRTFQRPRGYQAPKTPLGMQIFKGVGPVLMFGVFIIGWGFGLYFLFKTKNWDALTKRLPLAICALVILQVALGTIGTSGAFESLVAIVAVTVLLIGTVLPAVSGTMLWINRRNPARQWAADQFTRGRLGVPAVDASIIEGVAVGAIVAGLWTLIEWGALNVAGYQPSISRELDAVDTGMGEMIGGALSAAAFIALAIALVTETFDRFRVNAVISTAVLAVGMGFLAATDQDVFLPGLAVLAGMSASAVLMIVLYRRRGFLAAWIAGLSTGLLISAMAARSIADPNLQRRSSLLLTLVVIIAAAGAWGVGRRLMQKPAALTSAA